jgi:TPP-dependent pyruvate/acetoin dehydrogenase alpha subunit
LTVQELIDFEREIADLYDAKQIHSAIHLHSGGEEALIEIFKSIRKQDWVLCTWRAHYQCLLKGVPKKMLKSAIIAGRSMHLCFPRYRILSSGIVGGTFPIAVGIALGIKRRGEDSVVHCFVGDMASETGIAHESMKYARGFDLPIKFHIEDNGLSAGSDTKKVWGITQLTNPPEFSYEMGRYAHAGTDGKRVF